MANGNGKILTADQELSLRKPIEDYVGNIQKKIDSLRVDGTDKAVSLLNGIEGLKRDRSLTKEEREAQTAKMRSELQKAKAVEEKKQGRDF